MASRSTMPHFLKLLLLVTTMVPEGALADGYSELEEEEAFVRTVVHKMQNEEGHLFRTNSNQLLETQLELALQSIKSLTDQVNRIMMERIDDRKLLDQLFEDRNLVQELETSGLESTTEPHMAARDYPLSTSDDVGSFTTYEHRSNGVIRKEISYLEMEALLQPGVSVVRGKHWNWGNQDGNPPGIGTVKSRIELNGKYKGWVKVAWNNSTQSRRYRMGAGGQYDLNVVNMSNSTRCGGILVGPIGFINYNTQEDQSDFWCTWTVRADAFSNVQLTMLTENFRQSGASVRVISMWDLKSKRSISQILSSNTSNWGPNSKGRSIVYEGPVLFVQLVVPFRTNPLRTRFVASFVGQGGRGHYDTVSFTHVHLTSSSGFIHHKNYSNSEALSFVIHPEGMVRNVALRPLFLDIEPHSSCAYDFVQIHGIGNDSWNGTTDTDLRGTAKGSYIMSSVGFLGIFFSDHAHTAGGFVFEYGTSRAHLDIPIFSSVDNESGPTEEMHTSGELSGHDMATLITSGTKVVRGDDWEWDDQDGEPPTEGTARSEVNLYGDNAGWVNVRWKSGVERSYRMGFRDKYDLRVVNLANSTTCGGVLEGPSGFIDYQSEMGAMDLWCTWTVQAGTFESVHVELLRDNFKETGSSLRLRSMWHFKQLNFSDSWVDIGDVPSTHYGPVLFIHFTTGSTSSASSGKCLLAFWGRGNEKKFEHVKFQHYHLQTPAGSFSHKNYTEREEVSFVVHPEGPKRNVALSNHLLMLEGHNRCAYDFLMVYGIESGTTFGPKVPRWCGDNPVNARDPIYSPVGFVVAFFSDSSHNGEGFSFDYSVVAEIHKTTTTTPRTEIPVVVRSEYVQAIASLLKPGVSVVRGRDWTYEDQDGGTLSNGVVVSPVQKGVVRVRWNVGKDYSYRMGKDNKYDLRIEKASCGGVLIGANIVLHYEDNKENDNGCTWTIRADVFESLKVTMVEENFVESGASLRLTEMSVFYPRNASHAPLNRAGRNWAAGSKGHSLVYSNPIFVYLAPDFRNTSACTSFVLSVSGEGNSTYNSQMTFIHSHNDAVAGKIDHRDYSNNERMSMVFHPNQRLQTVRLDNPFLRTEGSCHDRLQLYDIGTDSWGCRLSSSTNSTANCPVRPCNSSSWESSMGFVAVFYSDFSYTYPGFSFTYSSTPATDSTLLVKNAFGDHAQHGLTGKLTAPLLPPGVGVVRGPDWTWGTQDGFPPGEGIVTSSEKDGWLRVRWTDGNEWSYRMGFRGMYDLAISKSECGGVMLSGNGVLNYQGSAGLTDYWCTWTVRVGTYEKVQLLMVAEKFVEFGANLRITPLWEYTHETPAEAVQIWGTGSAGQNVTFDGPVVFLQLRVPKGSSRAGFVLSYSGQGSPNYYTSINFTNLHLDDAWGTVSRKNFGANEVVTFVIHPEGRVKNVTVVNRFLDIESHGNCTNNFVKLIGIGTVVSSGDRLCGQINADNGDELTFPVGLIGIFVSINSTDTRSGKGFTFDYLVAD